MAYNPDPLAPFFDQLFTDKNGEIFFRIPGVDFEIKIDEPDYFDAKTRFEYASEKIKAVNISFGVLGVLILFFLIFVRGYPLISAIPVWFGTFFAGIAIGGIILRNTIKPFYDRHRAEWARANGLPIPSFVSGALDVLRAESGKIILSVLIWGYIGWRDLF
jgi:hypothetical protein